MTNTIQAFNSKQISNKDLSYMRPGLTLRVHQKIKDGAKTRIQIFEGIVIAQKHGLGPNGTVTIRKIASGVGVERTFPVHSPNIEKFEVVKVSKTRRAKLYYLRDKTAREQRKKTRILEGETLKAQTVADAEQEEVKPKKVKDETPEEQETEEVQSEKK
ncbi:MAG: 50S ribosomal protein L19 [Parcubacteria group bacterium]